MWDRKKLFYYDTFTSKHLDFDCLGNISKEFKDRKKKLINIAYESIVNKNEQTQQNVLEVETDNRYLYMKYSQDNVIEPAKILNNEKAEGLDLRVGILQIGESIVRVETVQGKRNYTDILKSSIEISFTTELGKISIYLSHDKEDNTKMKVEIDEKNEARLNKLKGKGKSLGENCFFGRKSVLEAIENRSFKIHGNVPTELTENAVSSTAARSKI